MDYFFGDYFCLGLIRSAIQSIIVGGIVWLGLKEIVPNKKAAIYFSIAAALFTFVVIHNIHLIVHALPAVEEAVENGIVY